MNLTIDKFYWYQVPQIRCNEKGILNQFYSFTKNNSSLIMKLSKHRVVESLQNIWSLFIKTAKIIFPIFIRIYLLCSGDSSWQFPTGLYCTLIRSPPHSLPLKSINHIPSPQSSLFSLRFPAKTTHTVPILQSCLSLLISKSMFKGIFQCISTRVHSTPPLLSFTPLPPTPYFSTAFNAYHYILYLHRCYILLYCWCAIIHFFFPTFPEFHRVVTLLQTCSIYEFV
jgi:hypothetical protein